MTSAEEFDELLHKTGISLKTKREKQSTVDEALYKACLRFVIKENTVSEGRLQDAFAICKVRARTVIEKMDLDGYIKCHWNNIEILITKEQFEEIYGEQL